MQIYLESGDIIDLDDGASGAVLAKKIKKELSGLPLALRLNGQLKDLSIKLQDKDRAEVITFADSSGQKLFWHSSAHLLAQAVLRLFPEAKPSIGPAIEEGFFYDFGNLTIQEADLSEIEREVKNIVKERLTPQRIEYKNDAEAQRVFSHNPFKLEIIKGREETLSAYKQGDFIDLCTGPHIPNLGLVQGFKLLKLSGAYWRGDVVGPQLTRIYGISFPEKKMLADYLKRIEEARKRDHRVLGARLNLFSFQEEGPGMPFFHPRGLIIWNELLTFLREHHSKAGYVEIKTPSMLSLELWERSGHLENYKENMYTIQAEERHFAIKPMNCPGCLLYYKHSQHSYREFPLRIAEIGHVHRHELSGALSGLFRVRSFHQDDAHIFLSPQEITSEILELLSLADKIYKTFGLDFNIELSTRPEKSIGSDSQWEFVTNSLRVALEASGQNFIINEGDGAFYGPKIDFHVRDAIGRTWQCGTIQLDMFLPERFDLFYSTRSGTKERPIMIHRAIYGSIERFFGILVEHYRGRFPLWLSPLQIRLLTVADRHIDFTSQILQQLKNAGYRVEMDDSSESIGKKVRNAQMGQVNYILVMGDKELHNNTINIRTREGKVLAESTVHDFMTSLQKEIAERSLYGMEGKKGYE